MQKIERNSAHGKPDDHDREGEKENAAAAYTVDVVEGHEGEEEVG
jgi:hypothetical protein